MCEVSDDNEVRIMSVRKVMRMRGEDHRCEESDDNVR